MFYNNLRLDLQRLERQVHELKEQHDFDMRCIFDEMSRQKNIHEQAIKALISMNNIPKKNNVELDITPELAIMTAQTLKEYCRTYPLNCVKDNRSCPFLKNDKVCSFEHITNPCELSLPEIK